MRIFTLLLSMTSLCALHAQSSWSIQYEFDDSPRDIEFVGLTAYAAENDGGVASNTDVVKSTDGGYTWTTINDPDAGSGWFPKCLDLYFDSPDHGYQIVGNASSSSMQSKLFETQDGGANWVYLSEVSNFLFSNPRMILMSDTLSVIFGYAGLIQNYIQVSTDGNQTWQTLTFPAGSGGTTAEYDAHFFGLNTGLVMRNNGVHTTEILRTVDGGSSWTVVHTYNNPTTSGTPATSPINFTFPSATVGYALTASQSINASITHNLSKTTDAGVTWSDLPQIPMVFTLSTGRTVSLDDIWFQQVRFADEDHGLLIGSHRTGTPDTAFVLRTADGGLSWSMDILSDSAYAGGIDPGRNDNYLSSPRWLSPNQAYMLYGPLLLSSGSGSGVGLVDRTEPDFELHLFPNPTAKSLHVQTSLNEAFTLYLHDVNGRKVMARSYLANENSISIDLSDLPEGRYFLSVGSRATSFKTSSILIKR